MFDLKFDCELDFIIDIQWTKVPSFQYFDFSGKYVYIVTDSVITLGLVWQLRVVCWIYSAVGAIAMLKFRCLLIICIGFGSDCCWSLARLATDFYLRHNRICLLDRNVLFRSYSYNFVCLFVHRPPYAALCAFSQFVHMYFACQQCILIPCRRYHILLTTVTHGTRLMIKFSAFVTWENRGCMASLYIYSN